LRASRLTIKGLSGMCDFHFMRGGDYVVFLYKQDVEASSQYVTSTCQRHFSLRNLAARREFACARQVEK
jgi:hypothetical protein